MHRLEIRCEERKERKERNRRRVIKYHFPQRYVHRRPALARPSCIACPCPADLVAAGKDARQKVTLTAFSHCKNTRLNDSCPFSRQTLDSCDVMSVLTGGHLTACSWACIMWRVEIPDKKGHSCSFRTCFYCFLVQRRHSQTLETKFCFLRCGISQSPAFETVRRRIFYLPAPQIFVIRSSRVSRRHQKPHHLTKMHPYKVSKPDH